MKISLNWLNEFVEVSVAPRQLKADFTMLGLNVESFTQAGDDCVFDIEVTTNRPDCLSHYGVAREASTFYRKALRAPKVTLRESGPAGSREISIEIEDPDLCARYCGRIIQGVQVKASPPWLTKRLEAVGMRPINNVADVTNYVLIELGHPLHAFDFARLRGKKIRVRRAHPGEMLRTLDGVDRKLTSENLVIADAEGAVALAGVMGGAGSEISSATRSVMLESAWFEPVSVRRTAKTQGLHTEASHRFERGADIEMAPLALDRAAALIAELAGGQILPGVVDVYPRRPARQPILLRASEIQRILGLDVPGKEVERILTSVGFRIERGEARWSVTPPSFRLDVALEVDLIEEVARHYGYDRLPSRVRPAPPRLERDSRREKEVTISSLLVGLGYHEIIAPSMVDPKENARFTAVPPLLLANPLSRDLSALRSSSVPSMLRILRWNFDRDQVDLRFFELGRIYTPAAGGAQKLPEERRILTMGLSGHRRLASPHDTEEQLGFFDLKGDLETLFEAFDIPSVRFDPEGCACYEKGLSGRFDEATGTIAIFGQLSTKVAREYKLRQPAFLAEVDLERLLHFPLRTATFRSYPKFPTVQRDLSLIVPQAVSYGRLEQAIRAVAREELQDFRPVDWFSGGPIPSGCYSLLLRMTFQSRTRTLTAEEIEEAGRAVLTALAALDVRLRT